jgi:hypothetical protein
MEYVLHESTTARRKKKGYLEVTSMLRCQVAYQVHPYPSSTNGAYLKGQFIKFHECLLFDLTL